MSRPGNFTVLLTGSTGLLGAEILRDLLDRGFRVQAIARRRGSLCPCVRIQRILDSFNVSADARNRVEVIDAKLEGGIRASLLRRSTPDAVIHAAAAVKFSTAFSDLLQQNVTATEELLQVLYELAPNAEFHYVSTAYVCGHHRGIFQEADQTTGRSFHHAYEETKFLAERGVTRHCLGTGRPFAIYRPSIIAGSSRDGRAANFNGIYSLLRSLDALARTGLIATAGPQAKVIVRCEPEATKNLVPVDWVASSIGSLVERGAEGKTFHLTHSNPVRHVELLGMVRNLFGLEGLETSNSADCELPTHRAQKLVDRSLRGLESYFWNEPRFDRKNLEDDLGSTANPPSVDHEYLARILEYGRMVNWRERPFEDFTRSDGEGRLPLSTDMSIN